jgi:hypothetical protein
MHAEMIKLTATNLSHPASSGGYLNGTSPDRRTASLLAKVFAAPQLSLEVLQQGTCKLWAHDKIILVSRYHTQSTVRVPQRGMTDYSHIESIYTVRNYLDFKTIKPLQA